MGLTRFYTNSVTINRYARESSSTSKGDYGLAAASEIWSGKVAINEVRPDDRVFQDRHGVESTHRVFMPIPSTAVREEDIIVWGSRTLRIIKVRQPMEMTAAMTVCAHVALEAVEVQA